MYSMGLVKLCRLLGVSIPEGTEILRDYHSALPFVRGLANKVQQVAEERGLIRTILGRIRHLNLWEPVPEGRDELESRVKLGLPRDEAEARWKGRRLRRFGLNKVLNSLIQGSAGDQTKQAMHNLYYHHGKVCHLQVHDELCASVDDAEESRTYKREMEQAVILLLPVVADCKMGRSWGEATEEVEFEEAA
jgi:DNA polymerase I-like protein with 3'-5' exonuclease and polymerase domains